MREPAALMRRPAAGAGAAAGTWAAAVLGAAEEANKRGMERNDFATFIRGGEEILAQDEITPLGNDRFAWGFVASCSSPSTPADTPTPPPSSATRSSEAASRRTELISFRVFIKLKYSRLIATLLTTHHSAVFTVKIFLAR